MLVIAAELTPGGDRQLQVATLPGLEPKSWFTAKSIYVLPWLQLPVHPSPATTVGAVPALLLTDKRTTLSLSQVTLWDTVVSRER